MKPAVSARNFVPTSMACESFTDAVAGMLVLLHRLHGHVGGVAVAVAVDVEVPDAVGFGVAVEPVGVVVANPVGVEVSVLLGVTGAVAVAAGVLKSAR